MMLERRVFLLFLLALAIVLLPKIDSARIVGGDQVDPHSLPYQASIKLTLDDEVNLCGGVIVNKNTVLSAQTCYLDLDAEWFLVVVGDHDLWIDEGTEQTFEVAEIIKHPDFGGSYPLYENDLSILKLKSEILFSSYVQAIPLPMKNQRFSGTAVMSGWGDGYDLDPVLESIEVTIIPENECTQKYGVSSFSSPILCAVSPDGKYFDAYDVGGPLACDTVLCGVASPSKYSTLPGLYVQVSEYIDYIHEHW